MLRHAPARTWSGRGYKYPTIHKIFISHFISLSKPQLSSFSLTFLLPLAEENLGRVPARRSAGQGRRHRRSKQIRFFYLFILVSTFFHFHFSNLPSKFSKKQTQTLDKKKNKKSTFVVFWWICDVVLLVLWLCFRLCLWTCFLMYLDNVLDKRLKMDKKLWHF